MNKNFMNRLTMLAVTLMASMACFAQGKLATNIPPGKQVGDEFNYLELRYKVLENAAGYITKVVGFASYVEEDPTLMKTGGEKNEWTPYTVEIVHYVPAGSGTNGSPSMIVQEVAGDVFKTVNTELAGYVTTLIIDYSDDPRCQEKSEYVELPTTGNTFAGLTSLTEVKCFTPGAKVAAISTDAFATSVFNNASLIVPEVSMGKYAKKTGWKNFVSIYNTEEELFGDINGSGDVTGPDVTALKKVIAGTRAETDACDVNCSGDVTGPDVTALKKVIAGTY